MKMPELTLDWKYYKKYFYPYVSLAHMYQYVGQYVLKLKTLLIIRPKVIGDPYTELFSFPAAELVKTKANSEGWLITDLQANNSSREKLTWAINEKNPDFIIHYDHGHDFHLSGQENNIFEPALDSSNVNLLSGRAVSTVSCRSAAGLGPLAISSTCRAYLGYDEPHWINTGFINEFTEASNEANYALLEGKTFQEAYDAGYAKYTQKYYQILPIDTMAAALMLFDRNHLVRLGNPSEKAV